MNKSKRAAGTQFQAWCSAWILKEFPDAAVHNFKSVAKKIEKEPKFNRGKLEKFLADNILNALDPIKQVDLIFEILKRKDRFLISQNFWISTDQDLWNCIDLACYLRQCSKPIFIQVTAHTGVDKRIQEMSHVPWDFDHVIVQLWQKRKPGRIVVQQLRGKRMLAVPLDRSEPPMVIEAQHSKYEFHKIGEIKRGKYCPFIGNTLCDGGETGPQVL